MPESNTMRWAPSIASLGIHDSEVTTASWRVAVSVLMDPTLYRETWDYECGDRRPKVCLAPPLPGGSPPGRPPQSVRQLWGWLTTPTDPGRSRFSWPTTT